MEQKVCLLKMSEKITIQELREIVARAIDNCCIWVDVDGEIGGGYHVCSFCGFEEHSSTIESHYPNCLVEELERIQNSKIVLE